MKMHKTILTLLAIALAVIGTTTTVVHAEGPDGDELVDTPETLLPPANVDMFYELPDGIQQQIEEYVLPILDENGFTTEQKADFLTHVVDLEYRVRVLMEDGGGFVVPRDDTLPGGLCTLAGPSFYQNGTTVSSYASVNCTYIQEALTASAAISKRVCEKFKVMLDSSV